MRLLALDAALGRCSAAVTADGGVVAERWHDGRSGEAALLPVMAEAVLTQAGVRPADLDAVAATVGPGSFTGLRAALAFAQALSLASGAELVGVGVVEALAEAVTPVSGRTLWVAIDSRRRDRVFLATGDKVQAVALAALPRPAGPVAVAGDAAPVVAAWLAARGHDVQLTDVRLPRARDVARVACRRLRGDLPPLAARPLYLDAPEVRLAADPPRPPPR